jgi:nucleotide-binding universal stress UspA family protein
MRTSGNLLIAAIDFWNPSLHALEMAVRFATQFGGQVLVVHVVEKAFHYPRELSIDADTFADDLGRALKNLVRPFAARGISIDYELRKGDVTRQLVDVIHDHQADAVFVGIREGRLVDDIYIGTHTLHLVKMAEVPVIVVEAVPDESEVGKMLIPFDPRTDGQGILKFLDALPKPISIAVLLIVGWGPNEEEVDVKAAANRFADALEIRGITDIEIEIVRGDDPYDAVVTQLRHDRGRFDMVLLEHPDFAALGQLTLGSLVEDVVTKGRMPVICLPTER